MTPPDFDELARLWTQEQSPEEEHMFQQLARRAGRRAKALQHAETGVGILLILTVVIGVAINAAPATAIIGALIVIAIIWTAWRRNLGRIAMLADDGDRQAMLESALRSGRASLRRSRLGIALVLPGYLLGTLLKYSIQHDGRIDGFPAAFRTSLADLGAGSAGAVLVLAMLVYLIRSHVRMAGQVRRIALLLGEYQEEARLDEQS